MNEITEKEYNGFRWVDLKNPTAEFLQEMNQEYQFDHHLITDSLQPGHLPKFERIGEWNFIIFRAYSKNVSERVITVDDISDKVAFLFNDEQLLTMHKADFDFLDNKDYPVNNLEELVLTLLNKMLETYIEPLHKQSLIIDRFEEKIFLKGDAGISLEDLYFQRSKARLAKKILLIFQAIEVHFIVKPENVAKYNDIKDTVINHLLLYDEILESSNMLLNSHLAIKAQKSNDIMTLLAIFSAFFLPLTFIVGLYGMNFVNMPELKTEYGYYVTLIVMIALSFVTYRWFKKKGIL